MARTFTYLFGVGATLLRSRSRFPTRPTATDRAVPGGRGGRGLRGRARSSWSASIGCRSGPTASRPRSVPLLISLLAYFAGAPAVPAYAFFCFWVVLAGLLLLRTGHRRRPCALRLAVYGDRDPRTGRRVARRARLGHGLTGTSWSPPRPDVRFARAGRTAPGATGGRCAQRLAHRAGQSPGPRGALRSGAGAFRADGAATLDPAPRPGLVQGVQRSVRARRRRPRAHPGSPRRFGGARATATWLARLGGEEFAVLAPETDEREGLLLAERLRDEVKSDVCPRARPPDRELRGGDASRARDHLRRARCTPRTVPAMRPRRLGATARWSSATPRARRGGVRGSHVEHDSPASPRSCRWPRQSIAARAHRPTRGAWRATRSGWPVDSTFRRSTSSAYASRRSCATSARSAWPNPILGKAGPLTDEEREELERHPEIGARIVGAAQTRPGGRMDPDPPRAPGRQRLPARPARTSDPARGEDPRGRRRVCRDDRGRGPTGGRSRRSAPWPSSRRGPGASSTTTWWRCSSRFRVSSSWTPSPPTRRRLGPGSSRASARSSFPASSTK